MKTRIYSALIIATMAVTTAAAQLASSHSSTSSVSKPAAAQSLPKAQMANAFTPTGKVVARVNGAEIYDRDLLREMFTIFPYAQQHNGFPKELEPEIRRGALQMIIFEELVYQEAKRRHMEISPTKLAAAEAAFRKQFSSQSVYEQFLKSEVNGSKTTMRERVRRSLLIEKLLSQEVDTPARVTTEQARAQYLKNSAEYKHGEILRIQSISILPPNETKAVLDEAKKRADEAYAQAKNAKSYRDFGLLAEKVSDDDFHVNMGDHKSQDASFLPPPIVQAAAKMKPGDVSGLIQLGNNYTIFRLEARTPAGIKPFAEVKAKLQSDMQKEKTQQLRSALSKKLSRNARIETL